MGLLDRFRSQPAWRHPDAGVRAAAVEALPLDDQDLLAAIAREDGDPRVRRTAVGKLMQAGPLAAVAAADTDERVRELARAMLRDIACGAFEGLSDADSLTALTELTDPRELAAVAKDAPVEALARAALARLEDQHAVASVARQAQQAAIRLEALARVTDPGELTLVALKTEHKDVALGALEQIRDREALETIVARARVKIVARRARTMLRALDGAASAAAAAEPFEAPADVAGAGRHQQLDLCRAAEGLLRSDDWEHLDERLARLQGDWGALAPDVDEDLADRFAAACVAVRERLARHAAEQAAVERRRLEIEARLVLCEQIAALEGDADTLAQLEAFEAAWVALPAFEAAIDEAAALDERFEEVRRACRERHEAWRTLWARAGEVAERLQELEPLADSAALEDVLPRWAALQAAWAGVRETPAASGDLAARLDALGARVAARDAAARDAREQEARDNLQRAQQHVEQLEQATQAPALTLKQAERRLRDAKTFAAALPRFPTRHDRDEIAHRLKALQALLFQRVQELREIDEWQRWANASVQEQLCARMEALAAVDSPDEVAREMRSLQERWKTVSAGPREKAQELWTRFRTAQDALRTRLDAHFAEQAALRAENLKKKEALCEQAEALGGSTDWIRTADTFKQLQADWKTIGPVPRGTEKAIWERFRTACDGFFTRRQEDLARRKEMWSGNLAKKEALCAQVEALAESSDDWEHVLAEIKRLQAEWKTIGPVRKNRSETIWLRFRAACDRCFQERADRGRRDLVDRLGTREAICQELEALVPPADRPDGPAPDDLLARVREIRARWQQAGGASGLPREQAAQLGQRFDEAFARLVAAWPAGFAGSELDLDANRRRLEELCLTVERLVSPGGPRDTLVAPATRLAEMLREALAANTIGGRVDDEARWRSAAEEIKRAQAAWPRVGPVPEAVQRQLTGRFQRACRRFFDQREQRRRMSNVS